MKGKEFKDAVFQQFARVAAAFASPKRIEIIDVLAQGERNVETLASETGLSIANTSRHLQVLKASGLVAFRKEGLQVFYRLADPKVLDGYRALRELAEKRLAEVDRLVRDFFGGVDGMEPVGRSELLKRARKGEAVVVDVRPREEFAAGHITGALSIPLSMLEKRLSEIPAERVVVAYCRGPYCVLAAEAVKLLRRRGYRAFRLREGYPEWRDGGLPVEIGSTPAFSK
ncbi:MAG: ArsR family transcriptional regulator [Spirochaetes bacterium RBG_16_67_19]|nr:MAG: ArsR family transcriptional regulator [Spirochaetes bacterium RBG_16_67_19]